MRKLIVSLTLLLCIFSGSFAYSIEIKIDSECLKEKDIFLNGGESNIYCSFFPGERKIFNPNVFLKTDKGKKFKFAIAPGELIAVVRSGKIVTTQLISKKIKNLYEQNFPDVEIKIEKIVFGRNIFYDEKNNIHLLPAKLKFGSVYFDLFNGYKHYKIYAYVKGFKKVIVAKNRIKKGELLDRKNTSVEKMDITRYWDKLIAMDKKYVSKRSIPAGRIITEDYVIKKPDAFKGSVVKLFYKSKFITISTIGILMENAYKNHIVKIQNPSSKKIIMAKYIGNGKAFVIAN